jgi:hypothetical protein
LSRPRIRAPGPPTASNLQNQRLKSFVGKDMKQVLAFERLLTSDFRKRFSDDRHGTKKLKKAAGVEQDHGEQNEFTVVPRQSVRVSSIKRTFRSGVAIHSLTRAWMFSGKCESMERDCYRANHFAEIESDRYH